MTFHTFATMEEVKLSKQFNAFKVSDDMFSEIMQIARTHHRKQSEMIRELLRLGLLLQRDLDSATGSASKRIAGKVDAGFPASTQRTKKQRRHPYGDSTKGQYPYLHVLRGGLRRDGTPLPLT